MQCMYDVYKRIFTYLYFDFRFIFIDQLYCKCLIHICWISKEYLNQDSKFHFISFGQLLFGQRYHLLQYAMNIYQPVFLTLHPPPGSKKMAGFYMVKIGLLAGFAVFPSLRICSVTLRPFDGLLHRTKAITKIKVNLYVKSSTNTCFYYSHEERFASIKKCQTYFRNEGFITTENWLVSSWRKTKLRYNCQNLSNAALKCVFLSFFKMCYFFDKKNGHLQL